MSTTLNLDSDKVRVFPFGSERAAHPLDRVLNENNISALIRACTNDSDYVYYYDYYDDAYYDDAYYDKDPKKPKIKNIGFFLHGYKFQIGLPEPEDNDYTNLWAYIQLVKSDDYEHLLGIDEDDVFKGLTFVEAKTSIPKSDEDTVVYKLELIADGKIKNTSPTLFDRIYCGNSTELTT